MVMMPQPVHDCVNAVDPDRQALRIYLSPKGEKLTQKKVVELSERERLLFLCGHYEGVDQRVLDLDFDCEISVGDYVLTGGELPAMTLADAVARYVPGVLGSGESTAEESFWNILSIRVRKYSRDWKCPKCLFRDITPMWQNGEWNGSWK